MVSCTIGTGDYGYVVGMEVVAGRGHGCWVGKGLGGLMVRRRGGCECRVSLVLVYWRLLNGLRSVVQLVLQVSYLRSKVLEHVLHVGIILICLS